MKALVNVLGNVACKERCGPLVTVTLMRLGQKHYDGTEKKTVSLTDDSDQFLFRDVLPGKYRLEVQFFFFYIFSFILFYHSRAPSQSKLNLFP